MSTAPVELRSPACKGADPDPDICHLTCCTDDWAICGTDVRGHEVTPHRPVSCPMCVIALTCYRCGRPM